MTTYKVISAENKGVYKKGELIRVFKTDSLGKHYGFKGVDISKISTDNGIRVQIIAEAQ